MIESPPEQTATFPAIEAPKPVHLLGGSNDIEYLAHVALPPNWTLKEVDTESKLDHPRRKVAKVILTDLDSFIAFVCEHAPHDHASIYCAADFIAGDVAFKAILNDHGPSVDDRNWRDFTASFEPRKSVEWNRWKSMDRKHFTQAEFAAWIEENGKDIAGVEGYPTGAQMLEMALNMEANQDVRFKSAIRLQNGGVQLSFVQDDDAQTLAKMELFKGFALGMPVFWNGDPFRVEARLRYRVRDGKLTFWYELIRPDKILEAAAKEIVEAVRTGTDIPFYFGNPGI